MDKNIHSLDQLFSIAKTESPVISFEQTQTLFAASMAAKIGATSLWLKLINIFKNPFIMLGTTGTIITAAVMLINLNTNSPIQQEVEVLPAVVESLDIQPEVVVEKPAEDILEEPETVIALKADQFEETIKPESIEKEELEILTNSFTDFGNSLTPNDSSYGYNYSEDEISNEMVFNISEETSSDQFEAIKVKALKAGMIFEYKMNARKNRLKKLKMVIYNDDGQSKTSLLFNGDFDLDIGWVENESGKAFEFYTSDEEKFFGALGEASDKLDDIFNIREDELYVLYEDNSDRLDRSLEELDEKKELLFKELEEIRSENLIPALLEIESILTKTDEVDVKTMGVELAEDREESIDYKRVTHIISNTTTEGELKTIQEEAANAGISISQSSKFKKENLRELHLYMSLVNDSGEKLKSSFNINSGKNNSFSVTVVWRIDEEGNAVDFDGNSCQSICY